MRTTLPFAQVEPTNRCNLACPACPRESLQRFGSLGFDEFRTIIARLPGLKAVKLQGMGEPLLHAEFIEMMRFLRRNGIRAYSATNCTLISAEIAPRLAESADRLELSIDAARADTYERVRPGYNFHEVLDKVRALVAARRERNPALELSMNFVIQPGNVEDAAASARLAKELGLDRVNLNLVQIWSSRSDASSETSSMPDHGWSRQVEQFVEASRDGMVVTLRTPQKGFRHCPWYRGGCFITWDGYVTACCQRPDPDDVSFGNILEQPFAQIWSSERYRALRETLAANRQPPECRNCSAFYA